MNIIDIINNYPSVVVVLYIVVELIKVLVKSILKHKEKIKTTEDSKDQRITKIVFDMLESSQEGLATEKEEIRKLTDLLKRANFEITILERKVSTLMAVIDRCIIESPSAQEKFEEAMSTFNLEIENMRDIKNG